MTDLTPRDLQILAFERQWWQSPLSKEVAVRELFELSMTAYYQLLNAVIDCPDAMRREPVLVNRLRRQRAVRREARTHPRHP